MTGNDKSTLHTTFNFLLIVNSRKSDFFLPLTGVAAEIKKSTKRLEHGNWEQIYTNIHLENLNQIGTGSEY